MPPALQRRFVLISDGVPDTQLDSGAASSGTVAAEMDAIHFDVAKSQALRARCPRMGLLMRLVSLKWMSLSGCQAK